MKTLLRSIGAALVLALVAGCAFYWNPLWFRDQSLRYHLWRAGVRSDYVDVRGYRIHYFEAAPPDGSPGKPLLLVHGLGSRGEDWAPMIPPLAAAGYHVYAPDLLGYGRSDRPTNPCTIAVEEDVVFQFISAAGLGKPDSSGRPRPIDIAGWSMGGWIAAKLALDEPAWIDRLVLYDSAGLTFQPAFPPTAFVPTDAAGLDRLMALLMPHPPQLAGFVQRATLRRLARNGRTVQQSMDSMQSGSDLLDARLGNIAQPTLIAWGTADRLIPIAVGETMHHDIAGSVFAGIEGCGHLAPSLCPQLVLAATLPFLNADPPMRGGDQLFPGDSHPTLRLP